MDKELYLPTLDYDIIFGQSYKLVLRPYVLISKDVEQACNRLIAETDKRLQRANTNKK